MHSGRLIFVSSLVGMHHLVRTIGVHLQQKIGPHFSLCSSHTKKTPQWTTGSKNSTPSMWQDENAEFQDAENALDADSAATIKLKGGGGRCRTIDTSTGDARARAFWHNASMFKFAFAPDEEKYDYPRWHLVVSAHLVLFLRTSSSSHHLLRLPPAVSWSSSRLAALS